MSSDQSQTLLQKETLAAIDGWLKKYPPEQKRSAVIAALSLAQQQNGGWLSEPLMNEVAEYLDIPQIWVYEVANFYSMLDVKPTGRHKISICNNISCMLRGADQLIEHVEKKLNLKRGETTEDGRITLVFEEECLAACCGAPMMVVDGHYHENLTPDRIDEILDGLD